MIPEEVLKKIQRFHFKTRRLASDMFAGQYESAPEEVLKKIQRFHFKTRRLASDMFAGQYESAFKGRGIEFAEVREYLPGDDIRTIDWNVSARFGRPFVKVFHEERELTIILLLDLSGSLLFGTRREFKRELLA
jgi:uncharacterized protein (DUF58 family)